MNTGKESMNLGHQSVWERPALLAIHKFLISIDMSEW
jgi:hypothetical protein